MGSVGLTGSPTSPSAVSVIRHSRLAYLVTSLLVSVISWSFFELGGAVVGVDYHSVGRYAIGGLCRHLAPPVVVFGSGSEHSPTSSLRGMRHLVSSSTRRVQVYPRGISRARVHWTSAHRCYQWSFCTTAIQCSPRRRRSPSGTRRSDRDRNLGLHRGQGYFPLLLPRR